MELYNNDKILPREAYSYWPKPDQTFENSGKSLVRFFFYKVVFTEFELNQLEIFKFQMRLKRPDFKIPEFFGDEELIRIILGCKYDMKKAMLGLVSAITWRNINLVDSFRTLFPLCKELLNSGCMYFHGRDHNFRPLLVINVERLDLKANSVESYCHLLCFLLEFAVQKFMLPGQIENWIVLTDLGGKGLTKLPISDMKVIIKTLQDNFRCRMIVNYVVRAPTSLYFLWGLVKKFIEEHTIKKIRILKENVPQEMTRHFARNQYEEKYGGTAPNAVNFWPPCFPSGPFNAEGELPDRNFEGICTYSQYNPPIYSEVSSSMGDISENVNIVLPDSFSFLVDVEKSFEQEENSEEKKNSSESVEILHCESPIEDNIRVIFTENREKLVKSRVENEEEEENDEEEKEEKEYIMVYRNSIAPIVEETAIEKTPSKRRKYCKFCSKRLCVIY